MKTEIKLLDFNGKNEVNAIIEPLNRKHHRIQPLSEIPKSWEKVSIVRTSLNNPYNQSPMKIYKAKNGLRFSIYRDGCFYEYCGRITIN